MFGLCTPRVLMRTVPSGPTAGRFILLMNLTLGGESGYEAVHSMESE